METRFSFRFMSVVGFEFRWVCGEPFFESTSKVVPSRTGSPAKSSPALRVRLQKIFICQSKMGNRKTRTVNRHST